MGCQDAHTGATGEMRSSQYAHLLPSVLSTRMWIKQQNNAIEHLLEQWVEPLTAWAWKLGATYPQGIMRVAWKYLLQNHPMIAFVAVVLTRSTVRKAVRFAQSQQIAESIVAQAMQSYCLQLNTQAYSVDTQQPSTYPDRGV